MARRAIACVVGVALSIGACGGGSAFAQGEVPGLETPRAGVVQGPGASGEGAGATSARESRALGMPSDTRGTIGRAKEREGAASGTSVLRTILALVGVVAAILVAGALAKRLSRTSGGILAALGPGGRAPAGVLEILGRYPIGRGCTLILLKLDRRVLLVCQSASRRAGSAMSTLCEVSDADEVASLLIKTRDETGESVAGKFHDLMSKHEGEAFGAARQVVEVESARGLRVGRGGEQPIAPGARAAEPGSGRGVGALRAGLAGMGARGGGAG